MRENAALPHLIETVTGASRARRDAVMQTLWSGYGEIVRYRREGAELASVIVKHVIFRRKSTTLAAGMTTPPTSARSTPIRSRCNGTPDRPVAVIATAGCPATDSPKFAGRRRRVGTAPIAPTSHLGAYLATPQTATLPSALCQPCYFDADAC